MGYVNSLEGNEFPGGFFSQSLSKEPGNHPFEKKGISSLTATPSLLGFDVKDSEEFTQPQSSCGVEESFPQWLTAYPEARQKRGRARGEFGGSSRRAAGGQKAGRFFLDWKRQVFCLLGGSEGSGLVGTFFRLWNSCHSFPS